MYLKPIGMKDLLLELVSLWLHVKIMTIFK
jgi:hypothetical protein